MMQLTVWQDQIDDNRIGARLVDAGLISEETLREALQIHKLWRCRLGEVLVARGHITALDLAKALADQAGGSWVDLLKEPPDHALMEAFERKSYVEHRYVPWRRVGDTLIVAAVVPTPSLQDRLTQHYGRPVTLVYTGNFDIHWAIRNVFAEQYKTTALKSRSRKGTAFFSGLRPESFLLAALIALLSLYCVYYSPINALYGILGVAQVFLFIGLTLTLIGSSLFNRRGQPSEPGDGASSDVESEAPVYSVLVPFFGTADNLAPLAASLRSLNYPQSHLDIKLLVDPMKSDHIAEARRLRLEAHFDIVPLPQECCGNPAAAFNYGLQLVRGEYVMLCRSNDRPEAEQLKKAIARFRETDAAALEMKLEPHPRDQSVFSRLWSSMNCLMQDVGRGLSDIGLYVPVAGEALHFRTAILQDIGGLDPESGVPGVEVRMQLAAAGHVMEECDATTHLAGPKQIKPWLANRSRQYLGLIRYMGKMVCNPFQTVDKFGIAGLFALFTLFPTEFLLGLLLPYFLMAIVMMSTTLFISGQAAAVASLGILPLANVLMSIGLLMRANRLHPSTAESEKQSFPVLEHLAFQIAASWMALSHWVTQLAMLGSLKKRATPKASSITAGH